MSYAFRVNVRDALGYIETRQNFSAGTLTGKWGEPGSVENLTSEWRARFNFDAYDINDGEMYFVKSYDVPIAWYTHNSGWVVISQKFSQTTSRHQNIVRNAVATFTDSTEV